MNRIEQIRMFPAGWPGRLITVLVVAAISSNGIMTQKAYAHGTEKHENKSRPDAGLKHVHSLMSVYEDCFNRMSDALKVADKVKLLQEGERLLAASREFKGVAPYKPGKKTEMFKKHSQEFEREVTGLVASATQGNIEKTTVMFKRVEQKCLSCHAAFN